MLPAQYATPTAAVLCLGGVLACFAGYRLFRFVLGLYGFILGAVIVTQMMGTSSMMALAMAALAGGVVGAVLMVVAYFMGVGLVGAGLAALAINVLWRFAGGQPPTWLLVVVCVIGALAALSAMRFVVVFGTAIAGAWTIIVAGLALVGDRAALRAASAGDVWILYPLDPLPSRWWHTALWLGISVAGVVVQLATTKAGGRRVSKSK